jgi:hypothetical protein
MLLDTSEVFNSRPTAYFVFPEVRHTAISLHYQQTLVSSGGEFRGQKSSAHKNRIRQRTTELDHFSNIL